MSQPGEPVVVATNLHRLAHHRLDTGGADVEFRQLPRRPIPELRATLRTIRGSDVVLIDGDVSLAATLGLLRRLGVRMPPIVASDLVLRRPQPGLRHRVRRFGLGGVDLFLHYFRNLEGYARYFGIGPERSAFVPFKPNLKRDAMTPLPPVPSEGSYILTLGRSMRDHETFMRAVAGLDYPVRILVRHESDLAQHGARFDFSQLPANVELLRDDSGDPAAWTNALVNARIVALPILPDSLCASGVSTYLDAMVLGKPVVITRGPGADDVLVSGEAEFVSARDATALRETLVRLLENDEERRALARRGKEYADALGGEKELYERVVAHAIRVARAAGRPGRG